MTFANQIKTLLLLGVLTALLLWIGSFWGTSGLLFAGVFVGVMNVGSYFFSHKIVLMMYRAIPADKHEHKDLHRMVSEIAHLANIPIPALYIIPSQQLNAFATGRNPKNAVVACTEGIMKALTKDELKGVIAHEISHVKNRDILITTIAATIAGVISWVASMARWSAIFGFGGRDGEGGNVMELIALAIITPVIATLLQLALSRTREFHADATGARIIHNPYALASALEKIEKSTRHSHMGFGSQATSSMFIANPFRAKGFIQLLSTHPPTEERVKRLRAMEV